MGIDVLCVIMNAGEAQHRIIRPLTTRELTGFSNDNSISVRKLAAIITRHRAALSIRQAAEWGMGTFQRVWGRLQLPLPTNQHKRWNILELAARLNNYRARTVGLNQIRTVFAGEYEGGSRENFRHTYYLSARDVTV